MAIVDRPAPTMWALGDYRFATATVWPLRPVLVSACGIHAGQRVLDVAAGTGNGGNPLPRPERVSLPQM